MEHSDELDRIAEKIYYNLANKLETREEALMVVSDVRAKLQNDITMRGIARGEHLERQDVKRDQNCFKPVFLCLSWCFLIDWVGVEAEIGVET